MKRATRALMGALSLAFLAAAFGCQNSSGDSSALLLAQAAASGQGSSETPREAAGKKYDEMDGVWDSYHWRGASFDSGTRKFGELEFRGRDHDVPSNEMNWPLRLSVSNRTATLTYHAKGDYVSEAEWRLPEFLAFAEVDSADAERIRSTGASGFYNLQPGDLFFKSGSDYLRLQKDKNVMGVTAIKVFYLNSAGESAWIEFTKGGESSQSGGGSATQGGSSGESSGQQEFSLLGKWKMKGDSASGRYMEIKDGSFDFYKNGQLYGLYENRTFVRNGSSVTVGYKAASMTVSDTFKVSGAASEMKWTLEKGSYTAGGQTFEDSSSSMALQAFWELTGSEVTLVPYE